MPRGVRKKLTETTELPVIHTKEEIGSIPFFILEEDKYGIATDKIAYSLVRRKQASKTVKDEEGNEDHVETYYMWESFKWGRTIESVVDSYICHKTKELDGALVKEHDINKLNSNRDKVLEILRKAFKPTGINKEIIEFSDLVEKKDGIMKSIEELEEKKKELLEATNSLEELIKETTKKLVPKSTKTSSKKK